MSTPDDDELGQLIRREATRHAPPAGLAHRIRRELDESAAKASTASRRYGSRRPGWPWLQAAALFGTGAATAWGLALVLLVAPAPDLLGDAVVEGHVRSLMASHLADVASSDRHTVKPWFAGRLDFSPPVIDLADAGLPLAGGRLDYLDGRAVAALVYRSGPHVINLFVWPTAGNAQVAPAFSSQRGYNLVHWAEHGMQMWAVSDLAAGELQGFARRLHERVGAPDAGGR